ncbi:MAG: hypothetical protein WD845_17560 [Pirellulales bacterium]
MAIRKSGLLVPAVVGLAMVGAAPWVSGQDAALPGASSQAASRAPQPAADSDAALKQQILASDCWRRAMFELNEWLATQQVYSPEQVAQIKADFAARVDKMSPNELQFVLQDLEAKFEILDTQQAREVRAWLGSYLSILSDRGREELLQLIPEFSTINAAQLQQTIARLAQRRDARGRQQSQVQQLRGSTTNPWNQPGPVSPRRTAQRTSYRSPYRAPSFERPLENARPARNRMTVSPQGGVWMHLGF